MKKTLKPYDYKAVLFAYSCYEQRFPSDKKFQAYARLFRFRLVENGFAGPKRFRGFRETGSSSATSFLIAGYIKDKSFQTPSFNKFSLFVAIFYTTLLRTHQAPKGFPSSSSGSQGRKKIIQFGKNRKPTWSTIDYVRHINIQAWVRGFRVKIANFLCFFCPSIPKRDLDTKKTTLNIEVWPESLGAMLEYWYIERGLLALHWSSETSISWSKKTRELKAVVSS